IDGANTSGKVNDSPRHWGGDGRFAANAAAQCSRARQNTRLERTDADERNAFPHSVRNAMKRVALRRRLLLLVATGLLPVAIMSALGLYGLYLEQRTQTERTASELARALSTALDTELQQSIAALQVLAASPRLDRPELESFRIQLERTV